MRPILFILMVALMSGCLTRKKILRKAEKLTDTTYVTKVETVVIPKDSAIVSFKTDTTYVKVVEKQGRARVTVIRTPVETIAKAECDQDTLYLPVTVPCPPQLQIGVNEHWRTAALILGGLLLVLTVSFITFIAGNRYAHRTQTKL